MHQNLYFGIFKILASLIFMLKMLIFLHYVETQKIAFYITCLNEKKNNVLMRANVLTI